VQTCPPEHEAFPEHGVPQTPPWQTRPAPQALESVHAAQTPPVQKPERQSRGRAQPASLAQGPQRVPPQSTPVSGAERTPSTQVSGTHAPPWQWSPVAQVTPVHCTSAQAPLTHTAPASQRVTPQLEGRHVPPAHAVPNAQVTPTQARSRQCPPRQSWAPVQCANEQVAR
jgi:hypothetical protein